MRKIPTTKKRPLRAYPRVKKTADNEYSVNCSKDWRVENLMGMRTQEAAHGIYTTAIAALGNLAEKHANLATAMFAELEPQDAIEAMLVAQMTATHVAMTVMMEKVSYQTSTEIRESLERSTTRLSRTYLAQMEALKKHRAKAQQIVSVERVNVESGGQAIVGDVSAVGRAAHEK